MAIKGMKKHLSNLYELFVEYNIHDINELMLIRHRNTKTTQTVRKHIKDAKPWVYALYQVKPNKLKLLKWLEPKELDALRKMGVQE